jgi:hypothetical protein
MSTHTLLLDSPTPVEKSRSSTQNPLDDAGCPDRFIQRVINLFVENDLPALKPSQMATIAKAALDTQRIFFAAAVFEPAQLDLDSFFDRFVMSCAQRT